MPRVNQMVPTFMDLLERECIWLLCKCGRRVCIPPHTLIGTHGLTKFSEVFGLEARFRCKTCRRRPQTMWIAKWED